MLKAAVYLQTWLVQEAEKMMTLAAGAALAVKAPVRGKGAKKKKKDEDEEVIGEAFSWEDHRETAALRLLEALDLDLTVLWGHRSPDEAFLGLFSRAAYAILEQPSAIKLAAFRESLWRLIALPAVKFDQGEATINELVRILLGSEHAATHLAELMQRLLEEHDAVKLVATLLGELATLPTSEMGADAAGPKNIAVFLHALAARAPLMLVANLELLQPHLASEASSLRCGAVSAHGQLLIQVNALRGANPEAAAAMPALLAVPLNRLADVSSFVRSRALQTLGLVVESRALPIPQLQQVAAAGLARLADKNANVRRGALQLFATLLDFNPFGPSLNRPLLEERRDVLKEAIAEAAPEEEARRRGGGRGGCGRGARRRPRSPRTDGRAGRP